MGLLIYLTGFSGAGKTTIGVELQRRLPGSVLLDGDVIRNSINADLGFGLEAKVENIRRNNALIKMLYDQGLTVIGCFMASVAEERDKIFGACRNALKVQLTTPLEVCARRDVKGLYAAKPEHFAGVSARYAPLPSPDLELDTSLLSLDDCVGAIHSRLLAMAGSQS